MCLTFSNQLQLLHDLLEEHITYQSAYMYEYEQLKKLIQSLMNKDAVDSQLHTILPEIYAYSFHGVHTHVDKQYIQVHENRIKQWLSIIVVAKEQINKQVY